MSNPNNNCTFGGRVKNSHIVTKRNGSPSYIEFELDVFRNFLNKGVQKSDYPTFRYYKSDLTEMIKNLPVGAEVTVSCAYTTDVYEYKGKEYSATYFNADAITYSKKTTGSDVSLELPF